MLPSLQSHLLIQYWDEFNLNQLLLLLMDRRNTRSRGFWTQIGWEGISNTRSHMRDMERNTMSGYSEMIYLRTLVQNPLRIMKHNFMPGILLRNITQTKSRLEPKVEDLSRKDKKTYSKTW